MQVVLVHWYVTAGREDEFMRCRTPTPADTPGFRGETLYRLMDQPDADVTRFVNIGQWDSREDFQRKYGTAPTSQKDFEAKPRKRVWLTPVESV